MWKIPLDIIDIKEDNKRNVNLMCLKSGIWHKQQKQEIMNASDLINTDKAKY